MTSAERPTLSPWWFLAAVGLGIGCFMLAAGWTGPGMDSSLVPALIALIQGGSLAALWLAMALGLGCAVQRFLLPGACERWSVRWALGIACALVLDNVLGSLGVLSVLGGAVGWATIAGGALLLLRERPHAMPGIGEGPFEPRDWSRAWRRNRSWAAAPAVAVLLLAACSPPGWLWSTEFGGYDALSYHLQLPREWLVLGRVEPLEHNVYSFLPSFVESAYLHLMVLRGRAQETAVACQLQHAGLTLIAAWLAGAVARRWWTEGEDDGLVAASAATVAVLATGWTIVVGSLAYNEMAVAVLLGGALVLLREDRDGPARQGIALGAVVGAACGAKLTAVGFVALPLAAASLALDPGRSLRLAGWVCGAAMATLAPWLLRNAFAVGNPVFPFLTSLLGAGTWTAEQAQVFAHAHAPNGSWGHRLVRLWNQFLRFGVGANPDPGEPWRPLWGLLPWLGTLTAVVSVRRAPAGTRRSIAALLAMVLLQIAFWLGATHLQSRFLVPAVIPLAALFGLGMARIQPREDHRRFADGAAVLVILGWSMGPLFIYRDERGGAPSAAIGHEDAFDGSLEAIAIEHAAPSERTGIVAAASPAFVMNHLLPADARVLLVGDATPWRYRGAFAYQTVWDRGPLSAAVRAAPDDPSSWIAALRNAGFTHLAVETAMLDRWRQSGWLDPVLTPERLRALVDRTTIVHRSPTGRLVLALP
ncbi:MAG: hypothetical protein KDA22_07195 [Phycisphaerales bacterium]|nr:hypothetical protein [Phycisphaerales bacterium]